MTIYFNPYYDSSVFLTRKDCGLGKAFMGKEGLLSELELRAGLTGNCADSTDRVISYMQAMTAAARDAAAMGTDIFFSESFSRDDFGTAQLLLSWRDSLVKAGWDGAPVGSSDKLAGLAAVESHFDAPGSADSWRTMSGYVKTNAFLPKDYTIEVQCGKAALDPVTAGLFDDLNATHGRDVVKYVSVTTSGEEEQSALPAPKEILSFKDQYEAHAWIAAQDLTDDDVVAEADGAVLEDMLNALGKPGTGASDEGIGSVMRLMPLGISLFKSPVDLSALQAYLQSQRSPLNKLYCKVVKKDGDTSYVCVMRMLFDHICSKGGFGQGWKDIIDGALYDFEGNPVSSEERDFALSFIGMWENPSGTTAGDADKDKVRAFVGSLADWARRCMIPGAELADQFAALDRSCAAISRLIDGWSGATIPVDRVSRWASHICVPISIGGDYARVGSVWTVRSLGDIFSKASRLIWFASRTDNSCPYEYGFLSPAEKRSLYATGVTIPDKESVARMDRAYRVEGLSRCDDITVVTCERISGVPSAEDAILAEYKSRYAVTEGTPAPRSCSEAVNTDTGKDLVHIIDPAIVRGFSREAESYSSISTLLQSPVDYLLDYVKGYRQYGVEQMTDLETTEGTVAHAYIEKLGEKYAYDPKAMLAGHGGSFDAILDEVIEEKGLLLRLEENILEEKSFREGLRKSIVTLLGIIIDNGLVVVDHFEYELTADIPDIGPVYAKIDCLLKDPEDGKYVIIDFKNNAGKTYMNKIVENRELQLAVYEKVVESELGEVKFTGYYTIPRRTLFTACDSLKPCDDIVVLEQEETLDIFDMAVKGYLFRWDQIRSGKLEEAEGMSLGLLDYFKRKDLYALQPDYEYSDLKAHAYADKNITLKGGLN